MAVGIVVGIAVGLPVGAPVGTPIGAPVGAPVGAGPGLVEVGAPVVVGTAPGVVGTCPGTGIMDVGTGVPGGSPVPVSVPVLLSPPHPNVKSDALKIHVALKHRPMVTTGDLLSVAVKSTTSKPFNPFSSD